MRNLLNEEEFFGFERSLYFLPVYCFADLRMVQLTKANLHKANSIQRSKVSMRI